MGLTLFFIETHFLYFKFFLSELLLQLSYSLVFVFDILRIDPAAVMVLQPWPPESSQTQLALHGNLVTVVDKVKTQFIESHLVFCFALFKRTALVNRNAIDATCDHVIEVIEILELSLVESLSDRLVDTSLLPDHVVLILVLLGHLLNFVDIVIDRFLGHCLAQELGGELLLEFLHHH